MGVVDVNNMSLDELKQIKNKLHTCKDKVARLDSIVIYNSQIGENLCIITENEETKYGIMAATLDTRLGQELYLTKVGDYICPFSWSPKNEKTVVVDNILTFEDIIDIMFTPDLNKQSEIVTTNDIVLGLNEQGMALYKVRGHVVVDVTGLSYGDNNLSHHKIGESLTLKSGKTKILSAITEREFKNRIINYK